VPEPDAGGVRRGARGAACRRGGRRRGRRRPHPGAAAGARSRGPPAAAPGSPRVPARARGAGDLYHFHDPDLLPWGLLLRLATGRPVVYDVHEDYVTALADKPYLPRRVGRLAGLAYGALERLTRAAFAIVIAERYYARRFPDGVPVLNYPDQGVLDELLAQPRAAPADGGVRLLYTGTAAAARGAW
jgi:hypothetical protein